jgi:hypothetical protein
MRSRENSSKRLCRAFNRAITMLAFVLQMLVTE